MFCSILTIFIWFSTLFFASVLLCSLKMLIFDCGGVKFCAGVVFWAEFCPPKSAFRFKFFANCNNLDISKEVFLVSFFGGVCKIYVLFFSLSNLFIIISF